VPGNQPVTFGRFRLDPRRGLWRGQQEVKLAPKALALLGFLLERAGDVITKDEVFRAVWPDTVVSDGALTSCIRELRKALQDDARQPRYIETLHRRGYRFIARASSASPPPPSFGPARSAGLRSPTGALPVGREREIQQLHRWFARADEGERQIVFVTGEPGIGKTTVVEAFLSQSAAAAPIRIGRGQCVDHYGAGEPYLPVLEALTRLCREPSGDAVVRVLAQHAPTWLVQMPSLVGTGELRALRRRAQAATREGMLRELTEALEALALDAPVILRLEDLHWSDVSTLDWLAFLGRRPERARLLVLGTYRPVEVLAEEHPLKAVKGELQLHRFCHELALGRLGQADVEDYLVRRFRVGGEAPSTVRSLAGQVQARSDGNPLFMVNIADDLVARGVLVERAGCWVFGMPADALTISVPPDVRSMIERQFDHLAAADQRVLEVASVAGTEFSAPAVAAGLELGDAEVEASCTGLTRREQFLRTSATEEWPDGTIAARYAFLHALYREVLYERVPPGRRAALHTRVGLRVEAGYGERSREIAAELAMHFERGRDTGRAVRYLHDAAQNAIGRNAPREAIAHLERAIELLVALPSPPGRAQQELPLQIALGSQLGAINGWAAPEVERAYARAHTLAREVGDAPHLFPALWGLWLYYWGRGELARARLLGEDLLRLATRAGDPILVLQAHHALWPTLLSRGELREALEHSSRGIALYEAEARGAPAPRYGNHDAGACALYFGAWALGLLGQSDRAVEMSRAAIALARQLAHPFSEALALFFAATMHQCRSEPPAVRERAQAAIVLARAHGFGLVLAWATTLLGWATSREGQPEEGIAMILRGTAAARETGSEQFRPYFLALLADACATAGRPADGLAAVAEALATAVKTGERFYEAELYRLKGELLRRGEHGEPPAALVRDPAPGGPASPEECLVRAIEVARGQGARSLELRAVVSMSRVWREDGREADARRMLVDACGGFTEGHDTADLREAEALLNTMPPS
jgi:DNA-binding winged helix-turn-helix (wHTH) protein/predicted ATPase